VGLREDPPRIVVCPLSGKARLTKGQAKSTAKRGRGSSVNLVAYRCRACGGWHVGNRRKFS
jgi:hypothetical protein